MNGPQAALIRFSLRFRGIVIALAALLLGYGIYTLTQVNYDVFPDFAPPQVVVQTEAPGLSPEQVEALVTQPLENSLNGVPGLATMRSASIQGLSAITITFDPTSDIYRDRQLVQERLTIAAASLPTGVNAPTMTPLTSATSTILVIGLTSKTKSLMDLRTTSEWTLEPRLLAVPGVANISVYGLDKRSLQIQVRPDDMIHYGVGLNDIMAVARRATGIRGGGFIDTANQRVVIQTEGQSITPAELAHTVLVNNGGASVTLANVATVKEASLPPIGGATINGVPGVELVISGQYGANTWEVTRRVETALADLKPALTREGIVLDANLFRPANFIATAIGNVRNSLILGGILVIAVIFLFLLDARTATISSLAIPLSLLAAIIVLSSFGVALNTMTLGGLAIAIGVVVDDAVIDVENIMRRLRENQHAVAPRPVLLVILNACLEVRSAVVYATLAVVVVVLPVLALSGVAGRLFAPLGIAYILAVLASLAVALTVTPALALTFLVHHRLAPEDPPIMRRSKEHYRAMLARLFGHRRTLVLAAIGLTLAALATLPFFGASFIPELKEGHFIVHMSAVPGTSLAESLRLGRRVSDALLQLPAVRSVAQRAGRAELSEDTWGTHYSELDVDLRPGSETEQALADIRDTLVKFPGLTFAIKPYLAERMEEVLSGYTASVVVKVFGNDLDQLDTSAQRIAAVLARVRGARDVQVQSPPGMPQLTVRLRKADLERWGIDPVDALDLIHAAFEGATVGQTYEGNRTFDVIVIADPKSRDSIDQVGNLPLRSPAGAYVRLRQIADIYESAGRYQILHDGAERLQTVTANVSGRDVVSFDAEAKRRIAADVPLPPGYHVEFGGAAEAQAQSRRDLLINALIAAVAIVLLLSVVTRNTNNLLLILANLPFALIGGVLAVFVTGGQLSLGSMIGFVALFGITLRNSILMIAHYEHLVGAEGHTWNLSTAIEGAIDRLTPILMTSIVTALGVLPLALASGEPGREIEGPMAAVILGGLLTSMVLNLVVLPTLALRYGRFESVTAE